MATEAIKRLRYVYSVEGADKVVTANDQVAKSQVDVTSTSVDLEQRYAALERQQRKFAAANANASASINAANDNYGSFGKTLLDTASGVLSTVSHLKLLGVAAYALSPAFRAFTNSGVTAVIGQLGSALPTVAAAAGKVVSVLSPALQFFTRLSVPIGAAVAAFTALNAVWQTGADLLNKYANRQRDLFGSNVDADLAKLTKFQDPVPLDVVNRATELGARLQTAKDKLAEFAKVQLDLNEPALKLQSVWVSIVETIAKGIPLLQTFGERMTAMAQAFGNLSIFKSLVTTSAEEQAAIVARINAQNGTAPANQESQLAARARGITLLSQAMQGGASFAERFSNAISDLANPKKVEEVKHLTGEFERLAASIERHIAVTEADAQTQGKSAGEVERLRTEYRLVEAAQQDIIKNGGSLDDYAARIKNLADRAGEAAQKVALIRDAGAAIGDFANTFVQSMLRGETAAKSFVAALNQIGTSLASGAFKQLGAQLSTSLSGLLGGAGSLLGSVGGPLGTAALGIGASLLGGLFDNSKSQQEEAAAAQKTKEAEEQLKSAQAALAGLVDQLRELNDVSGTATTSLKNAQGLLRQTQQAVDNALLIARTSGGTTIDSAITNAAVAQANAAFAEAAAQLQIFSENTIKNTRETLRGEDALAEVAQALKTMREQSQDLHDALIITGHSAEETANILAEDLSIAFQKLNEKVTNELTRKINDLSGKGWINQIGDLFKEIEDASKANVDINLLESYLTKSAQAIVDSSQLTGAAFQEMLTLFPSLTGSLKEFTVDVTQQVEAIDTATQLALDAAEAAAERAATIADRLAATENRTDSLTDQLARFDRAAAKALQDEAAFANANGTGAGNYAQLQLTLAIERAQLINDFNAKELADQQAANDKLLADQKEAEDKRLELIKTANQNILDYLQSLLLGSLSPLSAKAQLEAARGAYDAQLALAKAGDIEALQNITKSADAFLKASQNYFGSSKGYQTDFQKVQSELGALAGKADGGWITGGVAGRDSVPLASGALGMPGEYVVRAAVAGANASWLPDFNATGQLPANENVAGEIRAMGRMISTLLSRIASLEEQGNDKLDTSIAVTAGQTRAITREQRFAARKRTA